jgi:hypothetical protein
MDIDPKKDPLLVIVRDLNDLAKQVPSSRDLIEATVTMLTAQAARLDEISALGAQGAPFLTVKYVESREHSW